MKKVLSFILSLVLVLPLAGRASCVWTGSEENKKNENWLGFTGEIRVTLRHDYSLTLREYTNEDFPELEIESIINYLAPDDLEDLESLKNNPDYRRVVIITLEDKSEESLKAAVNYLDSLPYVYICIAMSKYIAYGDVNCDRSIDLNDVSYMLKHIAGWKDYGIKFFYTADLDLDGFITLTDAVWLLQLIAGWNFWTSIDIYPGPY